MTTVLGGNPKSRMLAGTWLRKRRHLIEKGKTEGEYKYKKTCPHFNSFKLCSHFMATSEANEGLKAFLHFFAKKKVTEKINLNWLLETDMSLNLGCKGSTPRVD